MDRALPTPHVLLTTLRDVIDREVTLAPSTPFVVGPYQPATLGVFVDADFHVTALVTLDLALSAYAAAKVARIPHRVARECVTGRHLTAVLRDRLPSVITAIGATLPSAAGPLHLQAVHAAGEQAPEPLLRRTWVLDRRIDVRITVPGYGSGVLAVIRT